MPGIDCEGGRLKLSLQASKVEWVEGGRKEGRKEGERGSEQQQLCTRWWQTYV